jgi:polyhydroxyalkanoate synthase
MMLMLDALRRSRGRMMDVMGYGPQQAPYRIVAEAPGMRLRAYGGATGKPRGPAVLIVPAPLKRSYIWDLRPDVSVVRRCQQGGLAVFLLEWRDPRPGDDLGLAEFAESLPLVAVRAIVSEVGQESLILAGHSLGGAFAAIFAALHPELVRDLWLIDAPLLFGPDMGDRIAAMLRAMDLGWLTAAAGDPVAGSFITALAVAALPDEFIWNPAADVLASGWDADRQALHAKVMRWTHDELPLPRRLFLEVAQQLYRENRFARGSLPIGARNVGLGDLRTPVAAVLNPASAVVPSAALSQGLRLTHASSIDTFVHEPDVGCALQHVGPLVSPGAHARIWPRLIERR